MVEKIDKRVVTPTDAQTESFPHRAYAVTFLISSFWKEVLHMQWMP